MKYLLDYDDLSEAKGDKSVAKLIERKTGKEIGHELQAIVDKVYPNIPANDAISMAYCLLKEKDGWPQSFKSKKRKLQGIITRDVLFKNIYEYYMSFSELEWFRYYAEYTFKDIFFDYHLKISNAIKTHAITVEFKNKTRLEYFALPRIKLHKLDVVIKDEYKEKYLDFILSQHESKTGGFRYYYHLDHVGHSVVEAPYIISSQIKFPEDSKSKYMFNNKDNKFNFNNITRKKAIQLILPWHQPFKIEFEAMYPNHVDLLDKTIEKNPSFIKHAVRLKLDKLVKKWSHLGTDFGFMD